MLVSPSYEASAYSIPLPQEMIKEAPVEAEEEPEENPSENIETISEIQIDLSKKEDSKKIQKVCFKQILHFGAFQASQHLNGKREGNSKVQVQALCRSKERE
jgi:hypothetical protein